MVLWMAVHAAFQNSYLIPMKNEKFDVGLLCI